MGGSDNFSNLQIIHIETNSERGDKSILWVKGTKYQIKRATSITDEDEVANYPYKDKEYCIVILAHSPEYYRKEEEKRRQWEERRKQWAILDEDYPSSFPF